MLSRRHACCCRCGTAACHAEPSGWRDREGHTEHAQKAVVVLLTLTSLTLNIHARSRPPLSLTLSHPRYFMRACGRMRRRKYTSEPPEKCTSEHALKKRCCFVAVLLKIPLCCRNTVDRARAWGKVNSEHAANSTNLTWVLQVDILAMRDTLVRRERSVSGQKGE